MVKIIGKSLEEITVDNDFLRIQQITCRILGDSTKSYSSLHRSLKLYDGNIFVHSFLSIVNVQTQEYYDVALRLAEAYEKELGREFTLKKEYE